MATLKKEAAGLPERVTAYLSRSGLAGRGARAVPLTGDASDRRYFRINRRDEPSVVLALHAGPIDYDTLPFVNVARLMRAIPLPCPAILDHANDLGVLLLEDLGDVTLQAHLGVATPAEHASRYRQAVELISTLQKRGAELTSPVYLPYGIAFDVEKLTWELEFFVKYFIEAYRGVALSPAVRDALRVEWAAVVNELAGEPRVLCHRDYHSRNLMLSQGRLHIIDFQDARMGPDTYDLVSLLRDSYVDLTDRQVDEFIAYFIALQGISGTPAGDDFRRRFDLMALQRNLKALGTFGYQTVTRGNPVYIQYIPRTLAYARTNLQRHARFGPLLGLLGEVVEEFQ